VPQAKASDTEYCLGVLGPIRLWRNDYALSHKPVSSKEEKMALEAQITPKKILEDHKHYEIVYDGNVKEGAVLLGQSIGIINSIDFVKDIINNIVNDAERNLREASSFIT
jgi:NAD(P)H-dependent flavin oxidoreductase YrpB (nitropropane dioxygenase family)